MDYQFDRYQPAARAAIKAARESGQGKALLVMSGGLGKTIVSADDVADFLAKNPGRVLVLCHDPGVLEQSRKKFRARLGEDYSLGIFHGKEKTFRKTDVLFASFQILQEHFGWIEQFTPTEFDYIIVDEAHHSRAVTYEKVINYFRPKFILGLTATPYREDGKPLDGIFGPAVYQLDYATALSNGYLTPVNYHLMTYEISRINEVMNSNEKFSLSALNERIKTTKSPEELAADIKERLKAHHDPRTVVFCSSIEDVETFSGLLEGSLPLHSKLGPAEQESNLEKFRSGEIRTLVVMNMLNEGVDVPEIDVVIRLRPTNSRVLFQQQLFRGARISLDKDQLVVYDYVTNVEQLQILLEFAQQVEAKRSQPDGNGPSLPRDEPFKVTISGGTWHATIVDLEQIIANNIAAKVAAYTIEELLGSVHNFVRINGKLPTTKDLCAAKGMPSLPCFLRFFDSWQDVMAAAGYPLDGSGVRHMHYTPESLIERAQQAAAKHNGHYPTYTEWNQLPDVPNVRIIAKVFGSYPDFLRAAGATTARLPMPGNKTHGSNPELLEQQKKLMLSELVQLYQAQDNTISQRDLKQTPRPTTYSLNTYFYIFGTWNSALRLAGIPISKNIKKQLPKEPAERQQLLCDDLVAKAIREGRSTFSSTEVKQDKSLYSPTVYIKNFGSWDKALIAAGLEPNNGKAQKK